MNYKRQAEFSRRLSFNFTFISWEASCLFEKLIGCSRIEWRIPSAGSFFFFVPLQFVSRICTFIWFWFYFLGSFLPVWKTYRLFKNWVTNPFCRFFFFFFFFLCLYSLFPEFVLSFDFGFISWEASCLFEKLIGCLRIEWRTPSAGSFFFFFFFSCLYSLVPEFVLSFDFTFISWEASCLFKILIGYSRSEWWNPSAGYFFQAFAVGPEFVLWGSQ